MKAFARGLFIPIVLLTALTAFGQPLVLPNVINYQGRLIDGTNLVNGMVELTFRLYDSPTGGGLPACVDSSSVAVVDGLYSTYIGDNITWGGLDNALSQTQVWIEVVIGTNVMSPREQLVAVGYSRYASGVPEGAIHGIHIADNSISDNHIVDGEVTESKIANDAITGNKIADGVIGAQHIANGIIDSSKLADNSVSNSELAMASVTGDKIADGTISNADVAANTFWETDGNAGTTPSNHFVGTTDNQALELRANNQRILRLDGTYSSPNITGGSASNEVNPNAAGCTVSGGGGLWGENPNRITDNYGTIGGGVGNQAGNNAGNVFDAEYAAVGGGAFNRAEHSYATIAGGRTNVVAAAGGFVGGGENNRIGTGSTNSAIGGGAFNVISNLCLQSTIGGGAVNGIAASVAVIAGGSGNQIGFSSPCGAIGGGSGNALGTNCQSSTIAGGEVNAIEESFYAFIGGGWGNRITNHSYSAVIGGGEMNRIGIRARAAVIAGGTSNTIGNYATNATISGGKANDIAADTSYATIGGGRENTIQSNSSYSAIGGGEYNDIRNDAENALIGGGRNHSIGTNTFICVVVGGAENRIGPSVDGGLLGGGFRNDILGSGSASARTIAPAILSGSDNTIGDSDWSCIVAGDNNTIGSNAHLAVILGGRDCEVGAGATNAMAAGRQAQANHQGAFVWGDDRAANIASTNAHSVTFRAAGGYRLFSDGAATLGAALSPNATAWAALSDRNAKENFEPIDAAEILEKVAALPVTAWTYKADPEHRRYIGPVAQDFHAAFGLGGDTTINTLDTDGVTLAAIQGLHEQNRELKSEIAELRREIEALKTAVK